MRGRLWELKEFVGLGFSLGSSYYPFVLYTLPHSFSILLCSALYPEELVLRSHLLGYLVGFCQWRYWLEVKWRSRERLEKFFPTLVPWF